MALHDADFNYVAIEDELAGALSDALPGINVYALPNVDQSKDTHAVALGESLGAVFVSWIDESERDDAPAMFRITFVLMLVTRLRRTDNSVDGALEIIGKIRSSALFPQGEYDSNPFGWRWRGARLVKHDTAEGMYYHRIIITTDRI